MKAAVYLCKRVDFSFRANGLQLNYEKNSLSLSPLLLSPSLPQTQFHHHYSPLTSKQVICSHLHPANGTTLQIPLPGMHISHLVTCHVVYVYYAFFYGQLLPSWLICTHHSSPPLSQGLC